MTTSEKGQYRPYAGARGLTIASFRFDTNNGSAADGLEDPGGVVSAMTYSATGQEIATLKRRYKRIFAHAISDDGDTVGEVEVDASASATAANTVTVSTWSDADPQVALATNNVKITVFLHLYDN
jgi:hypothetical protein